MNLQKPKPPDLQSGPLPVTGYPPKSRREGIRTLVTGLMGAGWSLSSPLCYNLIFSKLPGWDLNLRPRVFVSLRSAQNYRPPDGMRPKSRMLAKLHHIPMFALYVLNFSRILFLCLRDQGKRQLPDPKFYYVLIFSLFGKYFVPDLNRASQA